MTVLVENNEHLILGQFLTYSGDVLGYSVTYIDKSINSFHSSTIVEPKHKGEKFAFISGNCLVKY